MSAVAQVLAQVRKFVVRIAGSTQAMTTSAGILEASLIMSRAGKGTISLDAAETSEFRSLQRDLVTAIGDSVDGRYIEQQLKDVLFNVVFAPMGVEAEDAAKAGVRALGDVLKAGPSIHVVYLPVRGIDMGTEELELGTLTIFGVGSETFRRFHNDAEAIIATSTSNAEAVALNRKRIREDFFTEHTGFAFARTSVSAYDWTAAVRLATAVAANKADLLNFLIDAAYGVDAHHGVVFAEPARPRRQAVILQPSVGVRSHEELVRNAMICPLRDLLDCAKKSPFVEGVFELCKSVKFTGHQSRIVTAIAWCGRASQAERIEERFLYLAIAWESLVTPPDKREILNQLCYGSVHILAPKSTRKEELLAILKRLYDVRSRIVHDGVYQVATSDFSQLRSLVYSLIGTLLVDPRFSTFTGKDDVDRWIKRQMMGE